LTDGPLIALLANSSKAVYKFRFNLIKALLANGYKVVVLAVDDGFVGELRVVGADFCPIRVKNPVLDPLGDCRFICELFFIFKRLRPEFVISYTAKPVIYGGFIATLLGLKFISFVTGLGSAFAGGGLLPWLMRLLYRFTQLKASKVIFLNKDDHDYFLQNNMVKNDKTVILNGEGVDADDFAFEILPPLSEGVNFLLIARLIRDKGVVEFAEAARIMKNTNEKANFFLLGSRARENRSCIADEQLASWTEAGILTYLGEVTDVRPYISKAHCVVLPSYGEGMPFSLLEAASMGRVLIATDVPGSRDVVLHGINGYLCAPKNASDLANKMSLLLKLTYDEISTMAAKSREQIENKYDYRIINSKFMQLLAI
jgi:glycosyltransferase involved in cell wall biosynthesis